VGCCLRLIVASTLVARLFSSGSCVWFDATIQMVGQSRVSGTARGYLGSALRGQDPPSG